VAEIVFAQLDRCVHFVARARDGDSVGRDEVVAEVSGPARPILSGERTALNLLQRMSGIATTTADFVRAVAGTRATIVDTRKTAPGLRVLDKFAVRCGGGSNHRFSLSDAALVKDNHLAALARNVSVPEALQEMRRTMPHTARLEVEVDRPDQIEAALAGGADIILLDNMSPEHIRVSVALISGRALVEASGGITLESVRDVAETGVDLISVGALTHSVRALDIGLDLEVE
jgi:nicotinate-nucleotide pyrophosphorylase (carboxylating)